MRIVTLLLMVAIINVPSLASEPLAIQYRTEANDVFVAEPWTGLLTVTNVSNAPVAMLGCWMGSDNVRAIVLVADSLGNTWETSPFVIPGTPTDEPVVSLEVGEEYQIPMSIASRLSKPGEYSMTVVVEFSGKAAYRDFQAHEVRYRAVWAGKITTQPVKITVKSLIDPADIAALRTLCRTEAQFKNGPYYDIWYPHSATIGGDDRFRIVLEKYPGSVFAKHAELAEARVWAGPLLPQSACSYDRAIRHLTRLIDGYWTSHITDDAELLLAQVYLHRYSARPDMFLRDRDKASEHLRHLIKAYPKSNSVLAAKDLLAEAQKQASTTKSKGPDKKPEER